ncbi:MAG: sugar transferase, partial [Caldilineaceae bacterium]|nr:sugar transferase [Caldilineaceae bacterium]
MEITSNANVVVTQRTETFPRLWVTKTTWKRVYQATLVIGDALMLILAFTLAYWVRFHSNLPLFQEVSPHIIHYAEIVLILVPVWLGLFALLRLYDLHYLLTGTAEYSRALNGCTSGMMLVVLVSFTDPEFVIARGWLVLAWLLSSFFTCANRWVLRRVAQALRSRGWFVTPAVIVGTNAEACSLAPQLCATLFSGLIVLGFIETEDHIEGEQGAQSLLGLPILGTIENLPEIVNAHGVEEVIVAPTALSREQLLDTTLQLSGMPAVNMSLSSGLYEIFTTSMQVSTRNSVALMSLNRIRLDPMEMLIKTMLDYTVLLIAFMTLFPFLLTIALLIKLDSPGPILYRRRVLGVGGKAFDAFKFRTMVVNGDEILAKHPELLAELQTNHKLKDDPRITRVGRWLRRTSLDEVPQIINVLLGQM